MSTLYQFLAAVGVGLTMLVLLALITLCVLRLADLLDEMGRESSA